MSHSNQSPIVIGISSTAKAQLEAIRPFQPGYLNVASEIEEDIKAQIADWTPRSERGGSGAIKWCEAISLHCNADIYRLKSPHHDWRVFFFLLDVDTPPTRHVEEIVEWKSNQQCYNDMSESHVKRLLLATAQHKT